MTSWGQKPVRAEDRHGSILAAYVADSALLYAHTRRHTHFTRTGTQEGHQTNQSANVNISGERQWNEEMQVCLRVCVCM